MGDFTPSPLTVSKINTAVQIALVAAVGLPFLGLIVLAVAVLPLLGVGGRQIFRAETPGPMKDEKLTPRITETAKGLWLVYFALTVACGLAYHWAGMSWVDAICHGFSTMGLGGFSTHDASFQHWDSALIDWLAVLFMFLAMLISTAAAIEALLGGRTLLRDSAIACGLLFVGGMILNITPCVFPVISIKIADRDVLPISREVGVAYRLWS